MGTVLNRIDFAAARAVRSAKLEELGVAPISMAPGEADAGHSHTLVEEVVVVQSGEGQIQIENESFDLCAGSVAVVPAGQFHALCNTGDVNLEAVAIFNSNVDREAVVLKTREEHFDEEVDVEVVKVELAALGKSVRRLQRQLAAAEKS